MPHFTLNGFISEIHFKKYLAPVIGNWTEIHPKEKWWKEMNGRKEQPLLRNDFDVWDLFRHICSSKCDQAGCKGFVSFPRTARHLANELIHRNTGGPVSANAENTDRTSVHVHTNSAASSQHTSGLKKSYRTQCIVHLPIYSKPGQKYSTSCCTFLHARMTTAYRTLLIRSLSYSLSQSRKHTIFVISHSVFWTLTMPRLQFYFTGELKY